MAIAAAVLVAPSALALSYAGADHGSAPANCTEVWVDTTIMSTDILGSSGSDNTFELQTTWACSGGSIAGRVYLDHQSASKNYKAYLSCYDPFYGTDGYRQETVSNATAAANGSTTRYFIRSYPDSGYVTGGKIDANVSDGGLTHSTGYFAVQHGCSGSNNNLTSLRVYDQFDLCGRGQATHSYGNAYYHDSTGFNPLTGASSTYSYGDTGCGITGSAYGNLASSGAVNFYVHN